MGVRLYVNSELLSFTLKSVINNNPLEMIREAVAQMEEQLLFNQSQVCYFSTSRSQIVGHTPVSGAFVSTPAQVSGGVELMSPFFGAFRNNQSHQRPSLIEKTFSRLSTVGFGSTFV